MAKDSFPSVGERPEPIGLGEGVFPLRRPRILNNQRPPKIDPERDWIRDLDDPKSEGHEATEAEMHAPLFRVIW